MAVTCGWRISFSSWSHVSVNVHLVVSLHVGEVILPSYIQVLIIKNMQIVGMFIRHNWGVWKHLKFNPKQSTTLAASGQDLTHLKLSTSIIHISSSTRFLVSCGHAHAIKKTTPSQQLHDSYYIYKPSLYILSPITISIFTIQQPFFG